MAWADTLGTTESPNHFAHFITETSPFCTPDLHLTYSKNRGNLGLVLKMKNIACLSILVTKHVKYTYLYLFEIVLYSIVAFKAN